MFRSVKPTNQLRQLRSFHASSVARNAVFGSPKSGPYSNLPFSVNTKSLVPFQVYYWGVLGFFFAFPFLSSWWHLKKSGSLA